MPAVIKNYMEINHYQVEPDVWVYLFSDLHGKKYVLVTADYLDFSFENLPHLLRFDNGEFHQIAFF